MAAPRTTPPRLVRQFARARMVEAPAPHLRRRRPRMPTLPRTLHHRRRDPGRNGIAPFPRRNRSTLDTRPGTASARPGRRPRTPAIRRGNLPTCVLRRRRALHQRPTIDGPPSRARSLKGCASPDLDLFRETAAWTDTPSYFGNHVLCRLAVLAPLTSIGLRFLRHSEGERRRALLHATR